MIEFIQNLQAAKQAFPQWAKTSREERLIVFEKLQSRIQSPVLDSVIEELKNQKAPVLYRPMGVVAVILPRVLSFRCLLELTLPALAAGNTVLIKPSSHDLDSAERFLTLVEGLFSVGVVNVIKGSGAELGQLMCSHPGVRAVCAVGRPATIEAIIKASIPTQKKLQLFSGANNSAFVLSEDDISAAVEGLMHSCFEYNGETGLNIKKIFVLENFSNKFVETFVEKAKHLKKDFKVSDDLKNKIREEGGKILCESPLVVLDLPHCSTLQQDEVLEPLALISPVKYSHEMIKWANTGYLGQAVQIWGVYDKAERMAEKIEAGQVWINTWIQEQKPLVPGLKQSFYGISDRRSFGEFYSERLILVS